ncbi:hypothetical protein [Alteraurantiacibacter buctensis]|uniref:Endonuclease n=1 Tax=Alteraurantiacibacter buctensis TaxID=1503981 RepID=A0A844Z020_9SPHN|nr:hypothetical protein [Alteraurantiacibacter buctensis]MXO72520.1 hypothetical protein [Alteraurantiacibacter buctensis]
MHKTFPALVAIALGAALLAPTASAEARERVTSTSRQPGHLARDTQVTRRDGATASSHYERTRGDGSVTRSVQQSDFQGRTRSAQTTRTRTESGSVLSGSATGRGGQSYDISGERVRTGSGYTASRAVTNQAGEVVSSRDASAVREDGSVTRSVTTTGPQRPRRP